MEEKQETEVKKIWQRKELKKKAKIVIKNNIWTLLFIGILMSSIFGEYTLTKNSNQNLEIIDKCIQSIHDGRKFEVIQGNETGEKELNQYVDEAINQVLFGTKDGTINDVNEKYGVTHGIFFGFFNFVTLGKTQLKNFINSFVTLESKLRITQMILILISFSGILVKIFFMYPISVGENRIFLESRKYKETRLNRIIFGFRKKHYFKIIKAIFKRNIYKSLWDFTIVGGIIKRYSYLMVSFIVAENPEITGNDAIKISKEMMNGHKWETFKLDLSFIIWHILDAVTFGIIGFWINSYTRATIAELYAVLREDYKKNKKYGYELLVDDKLFEDNELTKYPDDDIKIKEINYKYNYRISSIILFFFTFAFAGWLWEVLLYLFRDGILVNRGTSYGPWLPIYGFSCTVIILLVTRFEMFKKLAKNPLPMAIFIMLFATAVEYATSWFIEVVSGLKYWDYSGVFMNLNGRVCLECSLFFGIGGSLCLYIVAPFLERQFQKLTLKFRISLCLILVSLFTIDEIYSVKHPNQGEGITSGTNFESIAVQENK